MVRLTILGSGSSGNCAVISTERTTLLLDAGLSALLDDLRARKRWERTVVACFGEFGRTPTINPRQGRVRTGRCVLAA